MTHLSSGADCLVVIVNYRTAMMVIDCLKTLAVERESGCSFQTLIVDSDSGDNSIEVLKSAIDQYSWHSWVQLLPLNRNAGFAGGNNAGIQAGLSSPSPPESFLLLNPDTWIHPGAVQHLLTFLDQHPKAGIAGSRIEHADGKIEPSAFRFHSAISEFEKHLRFGFVSKFFYKWVVAPQPQSTPHQTDWVSGASLLVRRQVIDDIGLMDAGYFLYFEEVDFCRRANDAGWEVWHVPDSRVVHLIGQSTGVTKHNPGQRPRRPAYWFESRHRYFSKNCSFIEHALADFGAMVGLLGWKLRSRICGYRRIDPEHYLRDLFRHSIFCRKRVKLQQVSKP